MESEKQVSLFDSELSTQQVTRSNVRRNAVIIPLKKGQQLASLINSQSPVEKMIDESQSTMEEELKQA